MYESASPLRNINDLKRIACYFGSMKKNHTIFHSRQEAGRALAGGLSAYANSNSVVISINNETTCIAAEISEKLGIPMEYMPCHPIQHPTKRYTSVGSICEDEIFLHDFSLEVTNQISAELERLKIMIGLEFFQFYAENPDLNLKYKTVIVATDFLDASDSIIACIHRIKRARPLKIIVAVAVGLSSVLAGLSEEVDDIVCIQPVAWKCCAQDFFLSLPVVSSRQVKRLLNETLEHLQVV